MFPAFENINNDSALFCTRFEFNGLGLFEKEDTELLNREKKGC